MFHTQHIIIFISRGLLHITLVKKGVRPEILKTSRHEWNSNTLPRLFSELKTAYGHQSIRILLADEFSYLLELPIPPQVSPIQEREYIGQQLATYIPEVLHSNEWDFKEIIHKKDSRKVLIFAPVKYIYQAILNASQKSGLHVEAMEPVTVAGKRHTNPVIGLALKKDIKGKDEQVLNVLPSTRTDEDENKTEKPEQTNKKHILVWILGLLSFFLILAGGTVWFFQTRSNVVPIPTPTLTAEVTPSPTTEPTPEPAEEPLDVSILTVQVLNGTGVAGTSTTVADILKQANFKEVTTGNADSFTYDETVVQRKEEVSAEIVDSIAQLLPDYKITEKDLLTNDFEYDVLIIVGKKYVQESSQ